MHKSNQQETLAQQARIGFHFMKEAIVESLFNLQSMGPLQPEDISKCLNLTKFNKQHDIDLISSVIYHLKSEGRIQYITEDKPGWVITDAEVVRLNEL